MTPEQQQFIQDIEIQLLSQPHFNLREQVFFELRFDANRPLDYQNQDIAKELMPADSRLAAENFVSSIATTCRNVVAAIVNVYGEEMKADGREVEKLVNRQRGEKGAWQEVYKWLWENKFPRTQVDSFWQLFEQKADRDSEWMRFFTGDEIVGVDRGMVFKGKLQQKTPVKIPANQPLLMSMDFADRDRYLLLLNRGLNTRYLVCPSQAFAPEARVVEMPIWLPQKGAEAEKDKISFDAPGKEEYLAILLEEPLEINWLQPNDKEAFPICDRDRMMQLWEQLQGKTNWQAYYQAFEVVE